MRAVDRCPGGVDAVTLGRGETPLAPTVHKDPIQAGVQITRGGFQWGTVVGATSGPITFGFRSTAPMDGVPVELATFSKVSASQMSAVEQALHLWSAMANITFTEVNPGGYTDSATILVGNFSDAPGGELGHAYFPSPSFKDFSSKAGDVWFDAKDDANADPRPGDVAYSGILHELGHAIGLQHPGDYDGGSAIYADAAGYIEDSHQYTVMSYFPALHTKAEHFYQGQPVLASTPLLHDIAAVQRLYGANRDFAKDDTVYGFNSNANPVYAIDAATRQVVYCIWDGGGNDTLDYSGYASSQVINLRAGEFSNVGALTQNVSIALGAVIENARAGTGNDTLIGNEVGNQLFGGTGRDTLVGGLGDDMLYGGAGIDFAVFDGKRSEHSISRDGDTVRVVGPDGSDVLEEIEVLVFDDDAREMVSHGDNYILLQGQSLSISASSGVLFNDEEASPVSLYDFPSVKGTLHLSNDGSFTYSTPSGDFSGFDRFSYGTRSIDGALDGGADVALRIVPVSVATTTTLNLLALFPAEQIAATYAAFFGRAADVGGFEFWVNEFNVGLPVQGGAKLFANIASSFGVSDEAKNLYPFLADPFGASDTQISSFLESVYNNLFNRGSDPAGLAYWTSQVKQTLTAGQFVGSVLINIMSGAQDTADGKDITTLMGKVVVSLAYVDQQKLHGTVWTGAGDTAAATDLVHVVTSDPQSVLVGIQAAVTLIADHI